MERLREIENPLSGRLIMVGGATYKKLVNNNQIQAVPITLVDFPREYLLRYVRENNIIVDDPEQLSREQLLNVIQRSLSPNKKKSPQKPTENKKDEVQKGIDRSPEKKSPENNKAEVQKGVDRSPQKKSPKNNKFEVQNGIDRSPNKKKSPENKKKSPENNKAEVQKGVDRSPTKKVSPSPRKISPKSPDDVYLLIYTKDGIATYFVSLDKIEKIFKTKLKPRQRYLVRVLSVNCRVKDSFVSTNLFDRYDLIVEPDDPLITVIYEQHGRQTMFYSLFNSLVLDIASKQPIVV